MKIINDLLNFIEIHVSQIIMSSFFVLKALIFSLKCYEMNYLGSSPQGIKKLTLKAKAEPTQGEGY